ncbi:cupredoxin domain-containing protein [Roseovarius tibetensis]|uniref:cupredoxin domain-containing protein n=1 Tax=Roseovarius tibetensis TaxID=2685897 RepID=UPI003D8000AA
MKRTSLVTALLLGAGAAMAAGTHDGGHGHDDGHMAGHGHDAMMQVGRPGTSDKIDRTVKITMRETSDGRMIFDPDNLSFQPGETVRLRVHNAGDLDHEFVIDTHENNEKHRKMMQTSPNMEHDDPNAIRLAPGATGDIIWTFANAGKFQFACLIPGHMEAGMHGPIHVSDT